jgi:hypothetical protein
MKDEPNQSGYQTPLYSLLHVYAIREWDLLLQLASEWYHIISHIVIVND